MAWDLGDVFDLLRGFSDLSGVSSGEQGPARRRVGRWTGRATLTIFVLTAVAALVVWLKSESNAAFDQNGLPVVVIGLLALVAVILVHCVAALVANRIDRRAERR